MQGHAEAFAVLGGIPVRHIRYDNLKPAVKQVCFGRSRVESQRWITFRSHYGFDAFYCMPGIEGAHEKGGVEHEGAPTSPAWIIRSAPSSARTASGRSKPCVSEIKPISGPFTDMPRPAALRQFPPPPTPPPPLDRPRA